MAKKNSKDNDSKTQNNHNDFSAINFFSKIFSPIKILIKMHLKIASKELKNDSKRYISGILNLFIGFFFIIGFWILLNVSLILAINEFSNFNLFFSVLIIAGANLLISITMFLSAILKFKKPFLQETKKIINETLRDLKH